MSEDVSSTIRTGVTVILVAALVAVVLNLMVISQSILSGGQNTLQSGVDQVGMQEFAKYNLTKISGTDLRSAINLYERRDIAIVIRTKALQDSGGAVWGYNYGSILDGATKGDVVGNAQQVYGLGSDALKINKGDSFYTCNLKTDNGLIVSDGNTFGITAQGTTEYVLSSARFTCQLVKDKGGAIVGIVFIQF